MFEKATSVTKYDPWSWPIATVTKSKVEKVAINILPFFSYPPVSIGNFGLLVAEFNHKFTAFLRTGSLLKSNPSIFASLLRREII